MPKPPNYAPQRPKPPATSREARLRKLAAHTTRASTKYTVSGTKKEGSAAPKKVTLPKLKCLQEEPDGSLH